MEIFGNKIDNRIVKKGENQKKKYIKKFHHNFNAKYSLSISENDILYPFIGVKNITIGEKNDKIDIDKSVIVGNIRMGFGHYRISIAAASAANSMGLIPYWFDLLSFKNTTGAKIIEHLEKLYSLGSKLSQKSKLFNKFYWEPLTAIGFRKLNYNANDIIISELMTDVYQNLPKDVPFVATHVWPAQAAVKAGLKNVVNMIPDNWPLALHFAEGAIHTIQSPSSYIGYRTLKDMGRKNQIMNPMPSNAIRYTGHYVDHELVTNLENDSNKRIIRNEKSLPKRILLSVGGAGAQIKTFTNIIKYLLPYVKEKRIILFVNIGDHKNIWEKLTLNIPNLNEIAIKHFNNWNDTVNFSKKIENEDIFGLHCFYHENIFSAVYTTNLLMRHSDIMITKPSELAFYPIPKIFTERVGGHEAWGAIRASEIGDSTIECENNEYLLQVLKLMIEEKDLLSLYNENILNLNKIKMYHGAYKVIEILMENKK